LIVDKMLKQVENKFSASKQHDVLGRTDYKPNDIFILNGFLKKHKENH